MFFLHAIVYLNYLYCYLQATEAILYKLHECIRHPLKSMYFIKKAKMALTLIMIIQDQCLSLYVAVSQQIKESFVTVHTEAL